ncbi:MAG: efflux transporter outer membrane subunit [Burkholderiales bacterium]|nr:efflux transporter outer membrane subunit [Burkholderiales bacterium]
MKIRRICALFLGGILSGCGLWGPNYAKPTVDTPSNWRSPDNLSSINTDADLPDTAWWYKFNDPILNSLIAQALKNNPSVQQAIGNIIQAQGQLEQLQMGWVPTLSLSPGGSSSGAFSNSLSSQTSSATAGGNTGYNINLIPNYTINIMQLMRQIEAANANLLAAQSTKDAMRLTILSQVANSYFTLSEQNYQLDIQKQLVDDTGRLYQLAQKQYKDGYISLLSLQSYLQNYQSAKAQIPITENNIVATQNSIQVLINRNPGPIMLGSKFNDIPMDGIIPANIPSTVLRQRPDVVSAEQQLIAANANIGVATATFFPSINLTGGVGTAANGLNGLFATDNDFWQIKGSAAFPLIDLSAFGAIRTAKGAYYTAYYNYINTIRTAFQDVDNGLSGHDKTTASYKEQAQVYDSTVVAYKLSVDNFHDGLYNELQELNSKVTMDNEAITLANIKLQQLQSIVTLYQALAGGYNVKNTESAYQFGDARDA